MILFILYFEAKTSERMLKLQDELEGLRDLTSHLWQEIQEFDRAISTSELLGLRDLRDLVPYDAEPMKPPNQGLTRVGIISDACPAPNRIT
jgi:hypothetical protein